MRLGELNTADPTTRESVRAYYEQLVARDNQRAVTLREKNPAG